MRVPTVADTRCKGYITDRAVHRIGSRNEHIEPCFARKIGVVFQYFAFGEYVFRGVVARGSIGSVTASAQQYRQYE